MVSGCSLLSSTSSLASSVTVTWYTTSRPADVPSPQLAASVAPCPLVLPYTVLFTATTGGAKQASVQGTAQSASAQSSEPSPSLSRPSLHVSTPEHCAVVKWHSSSQPSTPVSKPRSTQLSLTASAGSQSSPGSIAPLPQIGGSRLAPASPSRPPASGESSPPSGRFVWGTFGVPPASGLPRPLTSGCLPISRGRLPDEHAALAAR